MRYLMVAANVAGALCALLLGPPAVAVELSVGQAPTLGFLDAMLAGLARDGGLYTPQIIPQVTPEALSRSPMFGPLICT